VRHDPWPCGTGAGRGHLTGAGRDRRNDDGCDGGRTMTEQLLTEVRGRALHVTFNRPEARNAMTFEMYQGLADACERVDADPALRVLVLRGAGGRVFVAGTDIAQFRGFTGQDGIEYEQRIDAVLDALAAVTKPVIAGIDGHCVGGGPGIASWR